MVRHSHAMNVKALAPDVATGEKLAATEITDKRGFAERWRFSTRMVDAFLAAGLPHLKIGKRRVRICIPEADSWMHQRFSTQRRAA